jgi:hypothetical protein
MSSITIPVPGPRIRLLAVGALSALLVVACAIPALGPRSTLAVDPTDQAPEHTISVSGTGRVTIAPDVADLRLGVQITKPTVKEARDAAAASMTKVVAALRAAGIAEKDIQTSILSLQPVYDYSTNGAAPKLTGYQLTNTVAVTLRDLDRISDAIDGAMTAGATTMDGVTFRVDDPSAAEGQARTAAMADAKARAQALASAAGVTITGVASISESYAPTPTPMPYAGALKAEAPSVATPVQPGLSEVQVDVSVVYLID